jgi:hypothetical protein
VTAHLRLRRLLAVGVLALAFQAAPAGAFGTATGSPQAAPAPAGEAGSNSFRKYWLYIGIPGVALGAAILGSAMILANRARRRKLERGELPDMPPRRPFGGSFD